ncbi:hypothetical protein SOVF_195220, partial [Spinacia oleracea]
VSGNLFGQVNGKDRLIVTPTVNERLKVLPRPGSGAWRSVVILRMLRPLLCISASLGYLWYCKEG